MKTKKIIATILIITGIFLTVVLCKNYFSYKIPNESMGVRSVISKGRIDTLFIGSSAYRKGIDMEKIVNELPGDSFMLTYNGNQPFNMYIELKEILSENCNIGRIVFDLNPSMSDRGADLSDKRLLWDISMSGKRELWNELKKEDNTRLFTFYDYWVLSNNDYMISYPIAYPMISGRYHYGGSTPSEDTAGKSKSELEALEVIENPGVNELQAESLENIISLCSEKSIEVIFLESPRFYTMEENENYNSKKLTMVDIINNKAAQIGSRARIITSDELDIDYCNPELYSDLTHMSSLGKITYTDRIIELLNE